MGLALGFARELLLIRNLGTGSATDAFLVALFIPDALRTILASGLLQSVGLPQWQARREKPGWRDWSGSQSVQLLVLALLLALLLSLGAQWMVHAVGPGLEARAIDTAAQTMRIMAWAVPGMVINSWLNTYWQAAEKFAWPAACMALLNVPVVLVLWLQPQAHQESLALAVVAGSLLTLLPMIPGAWTLGWRPVPGRMNWGDVGHFYRQLWPLLASASFSQLAPWLERFFASMLPEGAVTMVNLARKLLALPLVALSSLAQIVLGRLARPGQDMQLTLRQALGWTAQLCVPATALLAALSPWVAHVVLAKASENQLLQFSFLLAGFSACLLFAGWSGMLVRYFYAQGETHFAARSEMTGMLVHGALLAGSFYWLGMASMVLGGVVGVACGWYVLLRRTPGLYYLRPMLTTVGAMVVLCAVCVQPRAAMYVQVLLAAAALVIGALVGARLRSTMLSAPATAREPA